MNYRQILGWFSNWFNCPKNLTGCCWIPKFEKLSRRVKSKPIDSSRGSLFPRIPICTPRTDLSSNIISNTKFENWRWKFHREMFFEDWHIGIFHLSLVRKCTIFCSQLTVSTWHIELTASFWRTLAQNS